MSMKRLAFVGFVAALSLAAPSALLAQCPDTDGDMIPGSINGQLAVNEISAMTGNCGLEVMMDGADHYVQDQTPVDETIYRMSFQFDPSPVNLPIPSTQIIFEAFGNIGAAFGVPMRVYIKRSSTGFYRIWARVFTNTRGARDTSKLPLGAVPVKGRVCVEWQTGASNTGFVSIAYMQPETAACPPSGDPAYTTKFTTNQFWDLDGANLGAARGTNAGATGSMYFDEFESFRTLAP